MEVLIPGRSNTVCFPQIRAGQSRRAAFIYVAAGAAVVGADPCRAAAPGLTDSVPDAVAIDQEIIVTGTKRPERLQDVPVSIWAGDKALLDRQAVRDFEDLPRLVPSLTLSKTTQPANSSINIRGVGTYAFSIAAKPSVTVIVDGVPQSFQAQALKSLLDVQTIEVLRGPQTTLFGAASTAGAVVITTAPPSDNLTIGARAFVTDDREWRLSSYISGPLSDDLRYRVVAGASRYTGNLRNITTSDWVLGNRQTSLQGKLLWLPQNNLSLLLNGHWAKVKSSCCTSAQSFLSPEVTFGRFQGVRVAPEFLLNRIEPGPDNRRIAMDVDPKGDATQEGASLTTKWSFNGHVITAISNLTRYRLRDLQDGDGTAYNWGPGGANVPGAEVGGSANGGYFKVRSLSQEITLASSGDRRLQYLLGIFAGEDRFERSFVRGSSTLDQYGSLLIVPPTTSPFSTYLTVSTSKTLALFVQTQYEIVPKVTALAGGRIDRQTMHYRLTDRLNGITFGDPRCSTATPSGKIARTCDHRTLVSAKAALQYRPMDQLMLFASYDRGFKGAAFDLSSTLTMRNLVTAPGPDQGFPVADAVAAKQPVKPERVNAIQLGLRSELNDRLNLSLTLFDEQFRDFQAQSRDPLTLQNILNSVPKASSRGVELELFGRIGDRLQVNAYGAYIRAKIDRFDTAPCFSNQTAAVGCVGGTQSLSGKPLPNAPEWNASVSGNYDLPVTGGFAPFVKAGWHWRSKTYFSLLGDPDSVQTAYGIVNVGAGVRKGGWKASVTVFNLFDRNFALNRSRDGNWNINPYAASVGPITDAARWTPARDSARYVGLDLSYDLLPGKRPR